MPHTFGRISGWTSAKCSRYHSIRGYISHSYRIDMTDYELIRPHALLASFFRFMLAHKHTYSHTHACALTHIHEPISRTSLLQHSNL